MSPNIPWIWHWWIYNFLLNSAHLGKVWTDVCSKASSTFQCWIILFFCRFFFFKKETTPEYSKRLFIFLHKIFLFQKNKVYRNFNISEIKYNECQTCHGTQYLFTVHIWYRHASRLSSIHEVKHSFTRCCACKVRCLEAVGNLHVLWGVCTCDLSLVYSVVFTIQWVVWFC